jgi:hypothetical protein
MRFKNIFFSKEAIFPPKTDLFVIKLDLIEDIILIKFKIFSKRGCFFKNILEL